jgi:YD repeat-containing protein
LTYDSTVKPPTPPEVPVGSAASSSFGPLWKSNFHRKLIVWANNTRASVSRGDGTVLYFDGSSGTFVAAGNSSHKLSAVSGGFLLTDTKSATIESYDTAGKLVSISSASGSVLTFNYGENSQLVNVQSTDGRMVKFTYTGEVITKITAPDQGTIVAAYDTQKNLTSLTWQDGKVLGFLYEDPNHWWALTGKVDENNSRLATFAYDASGRAISSERAAGVGKATVSYGTPGVLKSELVYVAARDVWMRSVSWESAPSETIVTRANGQATTLGAQLVAGMPSLTAQSQPAGSGCAASLKAQTYDAKGNIKSKTDFQGVQTCYGDYDSSNRETVRVEGLAASVDCATVTPANATLPAGARKITTSWHPDWHLPVQVVEALRKTTAVYHGQPDPFNGNATANCTTAPTLPGGKPLAVVCKRVEQATLSDGSLDTSVAAQTSSYTYNNLGQVLSSVDPNGRTTTVAYYANTAFTGSFDPYINNVAVLLHGNGTNGSTSIEDSSGRGHTGQFFGNAQISTAQSKFGGSSLYFDGSGDYVALANSSDYAFGSGDFTIEFWVWTHSSAGAWSRALENGAYNAAGGWNMAYEGTDPAGSRRLRFELGQNGGGGAYMNSNAAIPTGQWVHIAVARASGIVRMFVNGVLQTATIASTANFTSQGMRIGSTLASTNFFTGHLDELRITKGVARYTASFTAPTAEFLSTGPGLAATGYSLGDVQSSANAAGHTTTFNLYDPAGRVRQMTDPKGVVTDVTYTPRGKVSTVTVTPPGGSARTTTYTYDFVGQMTGVALPDGTGVGYTYDAAHRLTGVSDTRGNTVTYTLDESGNRIGEEVRDPGGTLRRSVARSFDALNRLQQVTGAAQ